MSTVHPIPLAMMNPGESGVVEEVRSIVAAAKPARKRSLEHRLNAMGLSTGTRVTVLQNGLGGHLIVAAGGTRLCLDRSVALRLIIMPTLVGGPVGS